MTEQGIVKRLARYVQVRMRVKGRWVVMGFIILSCTTNDGKEKTVYIPVDDPTYPGVDSWHLEPVARAADLPSMDQSFDASFDSGLDASAGAPMIMPDDPSHVSLSFPKVAPGLRVALLSGNKLPYEHRVSDNGKELTLTLYIPKGEELSIAVSPADEHGVVVGEPDYFVLRPGAKLGTHEAELDESPLVISFQTGAETVLDLGDNVLDKQSTLEFMDGETRDVMHGVFRAERDLTCHVTWGGAQKLYSILNGPPECRHEPFQVRMRQGQTLGLYPVIEDMDASAEDPVTVRLSETD